METEREGLSIPCASAPGMATLCLSLQGQAGWLASPPAKSAPSSEPQQKDQVQSVSHPTPPHHSLNNQHTPNTANHSIKEKFGGYSSSEDFISLKD